MIFPLGQAWRAELDPRFQPGEAELTWEAESLVVTARLADRSLVSKATADDQPLHLLGDTLEIFLMAPGSGEYWEFHISCHNQRAALCWPEGAIERVRQGVGAIEDFRRRGDLFASTVEVTPEGWSVQARIPCQLFPTTEKLFFSVSRYDYSAEETSPVHSSTSPHTQLNFHHTQEWLKFPY